MKKYKIALIVVLIAICTLFGCSKGVEVNEENEVVSIEDVKMGEMTSELEENLPKIEEIPETTEEDVQVEEPEEEKPEEKPQEDANQEKPSKTEPNKDTTTTKPDVADTSNKAPQTKYPYYIKVNRLANCVTIYAKDENGAHTVPVKAMVCSVGKTAGSTPAGVFKISARYTWRYLYGNQYGQYATRFNGPILFHSVPYSSQSKDSLKTNYYNRLGVADSMGCVRLTCADAKWIYDNCANGTTVEVYDASNPGPLGKPSAPKIDVNSPYAGWDPTDPDSKNPWKSQPPTISGVKDITTDCGTTVDLLNGVVAKDANGNSLSVVISGTVDFNTPGTYNITYKATDGAGRSVTASAVVTVLELKQEPEVDPEPSPEPNPGEGTEESPESKPEQGNVEETTDSELGEA